MKSVYIDGWATGVWMAVSMEYIRTNTSYTLTWNFWALVFVLGLMMFLRTILKKDKK